MRVNGDQCRVDVRDLRQPPAVSHFANPDLLPGLHDVVDFTRGRPLLRIGDKAASPAHAVHRQRNGVAVSQQRDGLLGIRGGDHRRRKRAKARLALQGVNDLFRLPRRFADLPQHAGRAAVAVTHIVIQHVIADRLLGRLLVFAGNRGVHPVAIFVGLLAVAIHHLLAHHFAQIGRGEGDFRRVVAGVDGFAARLIVLRLGDVPLAQHTRQHHVAPGCGAIHRIERVKSGRGFRQTGNHRHFAEGQLVDRFAKIDLRRGADAIGAVAEVDLVQIQLKDFIFVQQLLDADSQKGLFNLTHQRLLGAEEEVTR